MEREGVGGMRGESIERKNKRVREEVGANELES